MKRLGYVAIVITAALSNGCGHRDDGRAAHAVKNDVDRAVQDAGRATQDAAQAARDVQRGIESDVAHGREHADVPPPVMRHDVPDHSDDSINRQETHLGEAVKQEASDAAAAEAKLLTEKLFRTK